MATNRELVVEHNGQKYSGHIATIEGTRLGAEDHGILTMYTHLKWPGGGVSLGGFTLDMPTFEIPGDRTSKFLGRKPTAYGLDYLLRVMEVAGVETYEKIPGRRVIALFDYTEGGTWGLSVKGIAHIDEDIVFIPSEHVELWREEMGE